MNFLGGMLDLIAFLHELPAIAERADRERLSVLLPAFKQSFPDLWDELVYCSQMESPTTVIAYLGERDQRLKFLKSVPNVEPTVQFLMTFIKERSLDDSNNHPHVIDGNPASTIQKRRPRRLTTRA